MEGSNQSCDRSYVYALTNEEAYLQADVDEKPAMEAEPFDPASVVCQFCGKSWEQVPRMFAAQRPVRDPTTFAFITQVFICNECVASFAQTLTQEPPGTRTLSS